MRSPEALRGEASRLLEEAKRSRDVTLRQNLTARALELAQQAEAIASFPNDAEGLRMRIAQYRHMLASAGSEPKQRVVADCYGTLRTSLRRSAADSNHQDRTGL